MDLHKMTPAQAKEILKNLLIKLVDEGTVEIGLGTPESRALIVLTSEKSKST